ncbi:uncharacterized protein LOC113355699 isoform X2 [Papaver somniferum]|uniref:uncharacterized protein LOC113355699 isoform X2 n=1 Tax=Papaver somniferum TaxID=3469 RepID=UPI000E704A87|nr:uncharacterized protein LOC113355699 isoform X2 [Papaver somniferum]
MASGSSLVSFGDRYAKLKKEKKIMAAGRKEKTINSWMMQHIELTYKNPNEKAEIYAICQGHRRFRIEPSTNLPFLPSYFFSFYFEFSHWKCLIIGFSII